MTEYDKIMVEREQARKDDLIAAVLDICSTGDIAAGFPPEGFLQVAIMRLYDLCRYSKEYTKNELVLAMRDIVDSLEQIEQDAVNSADYGRSELAALEAKLNKLENI